MKRLAHLPFQRGFVTDDREPDPKKTVLVRFGFNLSFVRHRAAFALRFFRGDVEKLMEDLRVWVDAEYGRRAELARKLGVSRQRVTDWLSGRLTPDLEHGLANLKILKTVGKEKKRKRSG